jgi:hypothetical protein
LLRDMGQPDGNPECGEVAVARSEPGVDEHPIGNRPPAPAASARVAEQHCACAAGAADRRRAQFDHVTVELT